MTTSNNNKNIKLYKQFKNVEKEHQLSILLEMLIRFIIKKGYDAELYNYNKGRNYWEMVRVGHPEHTLKVYLSDIKMLIF